MASDAHATIPANLIGASFDPGYAFGSVVVSKDIDVPQVNAAIQFLNGTGLGQIDRIGVAGGTLTNVTPGTTDTFDLNLAALVNPVGVAFTDLAKVAALLILNDETTAGRVLTADFGQTNGATNLMTGTVPIQPGHLDPQFGSARTSGLFLFSGSLAGYAVDSTHRVVRLTSGSAASLSWRAYVLGRHA